MFNGIIFFVVLVWGQFLGLGLSHHIKYVKCNSVNCFEVTIRGLIVVAQAV